jgi:uncharacterized protein YbjT (DUF2867 family)
MRILLMGSNGHLGAKLADALARQQDVELVARSRSGGVDVTDPASLARMPGDFDVVVDNVSAYVAGGFPRPGHLRIEAEGHANLAAFAKARGARAVLVGVLGSDAVGDDVPHFTEKRRAEEAYRAAGVPLVSVRPGMFLDQADRRLERGFERGTYVHLGSPDVPFAVVDTQAVVDAVVAAVVRPTSAAFEARPVALGDLTAAEVADLAARRLGRPVRARVIPMWVFSVLTAVPRLLSPGLQNLHGMLRFMASGRFVARTR